MKVFKIAEDMARAHGNRLMSAPANKRFTDKKPYNCERFVHFSTSVHDSFDIAIRVAERDMHELRISA